ncbi:MAG TPA: thiamine pyrophosphate-dependent dehydrogenase E1 component subunit alpha [Jatrophihabitans sp.]|nr:thiamine pyrophosphate-dependent dehydrogenase E1 component subunit alpha [Jatrophihabitans sp.]
MSSSESLYRTVRLIRRFEERALELAKTGEIASGMHPCIGQEAVAAGCCAALAETDVLLSTHRGHGHFLAKGSDPGVLLAEMLGRADGMARGRGGSFHPSDFSANIYNATGTVGHSVAIAAGIAWSLARAGTGRVVLCFFGDGAVSQGALLEGLNLASMWQLPVVYVCENNQYATTLPASYAIAGSITGRGEAFGIPSESVDGQDAETVLAATSRAVQRARTGGGPSLLVMDTYRYLGHHTFEFKVRLNYRPDGELEQWLQRDPLSIAADRVAAADRAVIDAEVEQLLDRAEQFALASPKLDPLDAQRYSYTDGTRPRAGVA